MEKNWFRKFTSDIPTSPDSIYKNSGWINWVDWLGTINKNPKLIYWPYKKARNFIYKKNLKIFKLLKILKIYQCPKEIPTTPYINLQK